MEQQLFLGSNFPLRSSEVEVSDNVCDVADESGLIQQRKSGGNRTRSFLLWRMKILIGKPISIFNSRSLVIF